MGYVFEILSECVQSVFRAPLSDKLFFDSIRYLVFLAVQDSSISDLVSQSVSQ